MLPEFYRDALSERGRLRRHRLACRLTQTQLLTLEIIVWLLQVHKNVKIERLAAHFPLPIKYESRRRHLQRFLMRRCLSIPLLWFPIIQTIVQQTHDQNRPLYLAIDRTQWKQQNLFVIALIYKKRSLPIYWQFLDKKGASSLGEQQALFKPVLKLFKSYKLIILGDREFHSIKLADWLDQQNVGFVLRQKKNQNMQASDQKQQPLSSLDIQPGCSQFFQQVTMGKQGFGRFSLAVKWKRKYRAKVEPEPWYLLTNLANFSSAVAAYRKRMGIEAMFKDCKTGGYHLEGSKASVQRLTSLVLLIAIAYTFSTLKGQFLLTKGQKEYITRFRKIKQVVTKNSNFLLGLYGSLWMLTHSFVKNWIQQLMTLNRNKLPFYQRGLRAMEFMQQGI
jgi:hypothetical protein